MPGLHHSDSHKIHYPEISILFWQWHIFSLVSSLRIIELVFQWRSLLHCQGDRLPPKLRSDPPQVAVGLGGVLNVCCIQHRRESLETSGRVLHPMNCLCYGQGRPAVRRLELVKELQINKCQINHFFGRIPYLLMLKLNRIKLWRDCEL